MKTLPLAKPRSYSFKPDWVKPGWETYYWNLNRSIRIGPEKFNPFSAENNIATNSSEEPTNTQPG